MAPAYQTAGTIPRLPARYIDSAIVPEQVHCLKELRELESSDGTPEKYKNYVPKDPEVRALLSRDKTFGGDIHKAAVADTLIITMKVRTSPCSRPHQARSNGAPAVLCFLRLSHRQRRWWQVQWC